MNSFLLRKPKTCIIYDNKNNILMEIKYDIDFKTLNLLFKEPVQKDILSIKD